MNSDGISFIKRIRAYRKSLPETVLKPVRPPIELTFTDDILPFDLYQSTRNNIEKIADQINKSFCFEIYDGTAVLMRRLIEMLLILSFKAINQEYDIRGTDGNYVPLSQIIDKAMHNKAIDLSRNAKDYLRPLKEQGDLSAHNPFCNCRKRDLEIVRNKFRAVIEELLYKSGILK